MRYKKVLSFVIITALLTGLFVFAVNSGRLKVSYGQLLLGLSSAFNSMSGQSYTSASELINTNISMKTWQDVRLLSVYVINRSTVCGNNFRQVQSLLLRTKP